MHVLLNLIKRQIFPYYLTEPCKESFPISPCTKNEILEIISNLDNNKTTGGNNIPIEILILAKEKNTEHLCFTYNLSFTTGILLGSLKIPKVTPVYKNGSELERTSYRPISLLSNLDKTIEKRMHKRLIELLNDQKALYKKQFGFQKIFSTAHAVISPYWKYWKGKR